jgi:PhnB protein
MKLLMHLNFPGNCTQAFQFYEKHLGGKIIMLMKQSQAPGATPDPSGADPVIHARLAIAGTVLIANDVSADRCQSMRSAYLYLAVDSVEEAERIYAALKEGGQIFTPLQETFYAPRFSQLRDQFGINWTLIHERSAP